MFQRLFALLIIALAVAACGDTGQRASDPEAAQQLLPNIAGFTQSDADNILNAFITATAGGSLATGNLPAAAGLAQAESVIQCLQDRGALSGRVYTEQTLNDIIPEAGVAIVVNQDRINANLLSCVANLGNTAQGFSAQAVTLQPCAESGNFTYQSNAYVYIYAGIGSNLCGFFSQHFTNLKAGS